MIPGGSRVPAGTELVHFCAQNYKLVGSSSQRNRMNFTKAFCLSTSRYTSPLGHCIPVCQNEPTVDNGYLIKVDSGEEDVQLRRIICDRGYRMPSKSINYIECSSATDSRWTKPLAQCLRVCSRPPKLPNASVITVNGSHRFIGAIRRVVCDIGFILSGSQTMQCDEDGQWHFDAQCWRAGGGTQ